MPLSTKRENTDLLKRWKMWYNNT